MSAEPAAQPKPICSTCGKEEVELKPFGRAGALICYDCWMTDDTGHYSFTIHDDGHLERRDD
jgi:predicted amidohydrolase